MQIPYVGDILTPKSKRPGYLQCVFFDEIGDQTPVWLQVSNNAVTHNGKRYRISRDHIRRDSKTKLPFIYFNEGNGIPLQLNGELKKLPKGIDPNGVESIDPEDRTIGFINASDDNERMEAQVVKQAFDAFSSGVFEDKRFLLLIVILIGGFVFLYYNLQRELDSIRGLIQ